MAEVVQMLLADRTLAVSDGDNICIQAGKALIKVLTARMRIEQGQEQERDELI